MSDPLRTLLAREADRLVAGEVVRPLAVRRPAPARRLAPVLAVVAVVALVVGGQQLVVQSRRTEPVARPTPASLRTVVPPEVVRTRLGAPSGHVNGPAVRSAELQASTAPSHRGVVLRTVGATRPSLRIDPQGEPLVDRCRYTYSDMGTDVLHGACDWGVNLLTRRERPGLTVEQRRGAGGDYLAGTAPEGTAGIALRSPGRRRVVVELADPGPAWGSRPAYVVWWPRAETDLVALRADGAELARLHVPSDVPRRASDDDPELGTVELPLDVRTQLELPVGPSPRPLPPPGLRADVLARLPLGDQALLTLLGYHFDGQECVVDHVQRHDGDRGPGGSAGCYVPGAVQPAISASRSFALGDEPGQRVSGSLPPGTARVRLSGRGATTREVEAFDAGPRWQDRAYFAAEWPSRPHTTVTALGAQGQVLATTVVRGLDPRAGDEDVLESVARCLQAQGVRIVRHPQPGAPPAYEYHYDAVGPERGRVLTEQCEDVASPGG